MKRAVSFVIMFLLIILVYQVIIVYFSNSHEVTYDIATDDKSFIINEIYKKDDNEDGYYLNINSDDNREYIFYIENSYNKQKKIINKIDYYEKDDYLCIHPIDINNKNDFEILCNDGKEIYSYYYTNTQTDISAFLDELKLTKKYNEDITEKKESSNVVFYPKNIYDNEYVEIYKYKSISIYNKEEISDVNFSINDIYKNTLGAYINNYFLAPMIENNKIKSYYIINCKTKETRIISFNEEVSTNSYLVGIVQNKLYLFDLTNKKEYEIDPNGSYLLIGDVENGFTMYEEGKWIDTSITEFTNNKITINNKINVNLKYDYDSIYESDIAYYLIEDNKVYKVYKNNLDARVLLLELNNYSSLTMENNRLYYISDHYLYRYDQYGIKTLVSNNEFRYNDINMYHVYND